MASQRLSIYDPETPPGASSTSGIGGEGGRQAKGKSVLYPYVATVHRTVTDVKGVAKGIADSGFEFTRRISRAWTSFANMVPKEEQSAQGLLAVGVVGLVASRTFPRQPWARRLIAVPAAVLVVSSGFYPVTLKRMTKAGVATMREHHVTPVDLFAAARGKVAAFFKAQATAREYLREKQKQDAPSAVAQLATKEAQRLAQPVVAGPDEDLGQSRPEDLATYTTKKE